MWKEQVEEAGRIEDIRQGIPKHWHHDHALTVGGWLEKGVGLGEYGETPDYCMPVCHTEASRKMVAKYLSSIVWVDVTASPYNRS